MSDKGEERESGAELWGQPDKELRALLNERRRWFRTLEVERKQEKLFELEVLLKGLVRYSNLNNHPIADRSSLLSRDFGAELEVVRNALVRAVILIRSLLPEAEANHLHFQNYVETRLLSDYQRAQILSRAINQATPIESLYVLCYSLVDFSELGSSLLLLEEKRYQVFYYLEQMIAREITANRYFNPFRGLGFVPHYDVVRSPRINKVVKNIENREVRKMISVAVLLLFKLVRYLSLVSGETKELGRLKDSLLIFSLINSESKILIDAFEELIPGRLGQLEFQEDGKARTLIELMDAFAFQLRVELKKIFELEIRDASAINDPKILQNGVARTRGMLNNIFQQAIIEICRVFDPDLLGRDVFRDFLGRLEQSLKLRRDIWLFAKVLERLEHVLEEGLAGDKLEGIFESANTLRNFVYYYQNMSFPLVRAYDREEFQKFFDYLGATPVEELKNPEVRSRFRREIHSFRMFLETTFNAINQRTELKGIPFGTDEAERLLAQFLQ